MSYSYIHSDHHAEYHFIYSITVKLFGILVLYTIRNSLNFFFLKYLINSFKFAVRKVSF